MCNTYELFLEVAGAAQLSGLKILVACICGVILLRYTGRNGITLGYR